MALERLAPMADSLVLGRLQLLQLMPASNHNDLQRHMFYQIIWEVSMAILHLVLPNLHCIIAIREN